MSDQFTGWIVPTTHWDRAWYWPFERFRLKLLECFTAVERLWERDPGYTFTMDGQAIPIEDVISILPEKAELLRRMGEAGRFRAGPHYVLNDFWCTGGESYLRNLQFGCELADAFAARQEAVYQPDTFGFPPSLPGLIRGFGFDTFIAMRGFPRELGDARACRWQSADGSTVQVYRLRDGYGNAARLGRTWGTGEIMDVKSSGIHPGFSMPDAVKKLRDATAKLDDGQDAPPLLLAGVDHQIPQEELPEIIREATGDGFAYRYATLDDVAAAMRERDPTNWKIVRGELMDASAHKLGGTVSSRIHLKQANALVERMLVRSCEPGVAALERLGIETDEPLRAVVAHAWKTLLKVHPHDDITGCGVDAVHREDEALIERARQAADALERRVVWHLLHHYGSQEPGDERHGMGLYSVGGLGGARRVRLAIDCEGRKAWGDVAVPEQYALVDEHGNELPFVELSRDRGAEHPHPVLDVECVVSLPPTTLTRVFVEPRDGSPATEASDGVLRNEFLEARVRRDGRLDLSDAATGARWEGLGAFGDQADVGDCYTFSPLPKERETVYDDVAWRRDVSTGRAGMQVVSLAGELSVPASSDAKSGRSPDRVALPVRVRYSLAPGERALEVNIQLTNTARDHRVRWCVPFDPVGSRLRAGLKFEELQRPVRRPVRRGDGTVSLPLYPADHYVAMDDGASGLAILSEHPFVYEAATDGEQRIAVTLLRAVGMLSVSEAVLTRGPGAGPDTPTPEAQLLGRTYEYRFGLMPFAERHAHALMGAALLWRDRPLRGVMWGADPDRKDVPNGPLIEVEPGPVVISALKPRHGNEPGTVVRLYNGSRKPQTARFKIPGCDGIRQAYHSERETGKVIEPAGGAFEIKMPAFGLRTFLF